MIVYYSGLPEISSPGRWYLVSFFASWSRPSNVSLGMTWCICWKEFSKNLCIQPNPLAKFPEVLMDGFLEFVQVNSGNGFFFEQKDDGQKCSLKVGAIPWYQWIYKTKRYRICVQKVFPTLLRPDFFHPHGFLGFTCGAMPPWNPEAQASFLGHLWYLGWEKISQKKIQKGWWFLGCVSSNLLIHIFIVLGGGIPHQAGCNCQILLIFLNF